MQNIWFFLLFNGSFVVFGHTQSLPQTLHFAAQQLEEGNLDQALKAYQRVLFFSKGAEKVICYQQIAHIHQQLGHYQLAAQSFDSFYFSAATDSLKNEAILQKVACLLLQQSYSSALVELFQLEDNLSDVLEQKKVFYTGIALYGKGDYATAQTHFKTLVAAIDSSQLYQVEAVFKKVEKAAKINPKLARTLSMIFPGAGQLYVGDIKNSINSNLLNAGLLTLFVVVATKSSVLDAIISISPWIYRYYAGGFNSAQQLALNKKEQKLAEAYQELIHLLFQIKTNH